MQFRNVIASSALLATAFAQYPPNATTLKIPSSPNELLLSFQQGVYNVTGGDHFGGAVAQNPTVGLSSADNGTDYVIVMIDPSYPYPETAKNGTQLLHWLETNFSLADNTTSSSTGSMFPFVFDTNSTDAYTSASYLVPKPENNSNPHEYVLYMFEEPSDFMLPPKYRNYSGIASRDFNIEAFISDVGLSDPIAATYFYVAPNNTIPDNFSSPPNSTYPVTTGTIAYSATDPAAFSSTTLPPTTSTIASDNAANTGGIRLRELGGAAAAVAGAAILL